MLPCPDPPTNYYLIYEQRGAPQRVKTLSLLEARYRPAVMWPNVVARMKWWLQCRISLLSSEPA